MIKCFICNALVIKREPFVTKYGGILQLNLCPDHTNRKHWENTTRGKVISQLVEEVELKENPKEII